jgi:transcriptional regulator CtsR
MATLAEKIEKYLKTLIDKSKNDEIEIQRVEIAETFSCVPSQINYVLETRFTEEAGYYFETKRGGGGYIKIFKLPPIDNLNLLEFIERPFKKSITQKMGYEIISRLKYEDIITKREEIIMKSAINDKSIQLLEENDEIRANILRNMLMTLLRNEFK